MKGYYPVVSLKRVCSISWVLCWQRLPPFLNKKFHKRSVRWLESEFDNPREIVCLSTNQ